MSKKKTSKVTIANIVTMLGLVALALFVFCGHALQNFENNMGTNIIVSLAFVLGVLFVLWLMIHAKKVENNFGPWRIVEVGAIVLFLGASYFTGTKMMKYFVINDKMETLKEVALEDVQGLSDLIEDFVNNEKYNLNISKDDFKNAKNDKYNSKSDDVDDYLSSIRGDGTNYFNEKMANKVNAIEENKGESSKAYRETWESEIKEIEETIADWNLIMLPDAVKHLEVLSKDMNEKLSEIAKGYDFKQVKYNDEENIYEIEYFYPKTYEYEVKFPAMVKEAEGFSPVGLGIIILIDILILASYIFAYRSRKVAPKGKGAFLGGAPLN